MVPHQNQMKLILGKYEVMYVKNHDFTYTAVRFNPIPGMNKDLVVVMGRSIKMAVQWPITTIKRRRCLEGVAEMNH